MELQIKETRLTQVFTKQQLPSLAPAVPWVSTGVCLQLWVSPHRALFLAAQEFNWGRIRGVACQLSIDGSWEEVEKLPSPRWKMPYNWHGFEWEHPGNTTETITVGQQWIRNINKWYCLHYLCFAWPTFNSMIFILSRYVTVEKFLFSWQT